MISVYSYLYIYMYIMYTYITCITYIHLYIHNTRIYSLSGVSMWVRFYLFHDCKLSGVYIFTHEHMSIDVSYTYV